MASKKAVLMVCLGNICRSTLAQGILESKVDRNHITVDSAGTGSWHVGDPPDHRSIRTGKAHGIDISRQRGRQIQKEDFERFDYIYVMDHANYQDVQELAPTEEAREKVAMILKETPSLKQEAVPDPYHGDLEDFERVYTMLDQACDRIAHTLNSKVKTSK